MTISIEHGPLEHVGYQVGPDGRERAIYASNWEPAGSLVPTQSADS